MQGGDGFARGYHHWTATSTNVDFHNGYLQKFGFDFTSQFLLVREFCHNLFDFVIYDRTIGFHDVIGQAVGIVAISMMNAKCRKESSAD